MSSGTPLLALLRARGADVEVPDTSPGHAALPDLVAAMRSAVESRDDPARSLAAWDVAGRLHTPEILDEALRRTAPRLGVPFVSGLRRRRLGASARDALERTEAPGTVRLLVAVLGAVGGRDDAQALEAVATHPAFAMHAVTALANLGHWEGRAALLRLLSRTDGPSRVIVIDRLLAFVREPVVRLALVRDAFDGLDPASAREIAAAVVDTVGVRAWLADERVADDVREKARALVELADAAGP